MLTAVAFGLSLNEESQIGRLKLPAFKANRESVSTSHLAKRLATLFRLPIIETVRPVPVSYLNLLEASAKRIAVLYQHRWQIELFFRWFKSIGHFGKLIAHRAARADACADRNSFGPSRATISHASHKPRRYHLRFPTPNQIPGRYWAKPVAHKC